LVHAPRDSFLSSYCREHGCAIVVDEPRPKLLQEALEKLLHDPTGMARMVENAWECATKDFSPDLARARFFQLFRGH
jgi:UDP-N-acetylglucosamine:LPS N-acetylglucosamine transferase